MSTGIVESIAQAARHHNGLHHACCSNRQGLEGESHMLQMFWIMTKEEQPRTGPTEDVSMTKLLSSPCSEQSDLAPKTHPCMSMD